MIYVCEHHDQLLRLWHEADARGIRLTHVDFHDDMRGLFINRRRGYAYAIGQLARGRAAVDSGNFLAHAAIEGRLERVRWVHTSPGGRAWDMGIVRYESDLFAWPHRLLRGLLGSRKFSLQFDELLLDDWSGIEQGESLSIDWDCFASTLQDREGISGRVERFLARLGEEEPGEIFIASSPEYSRDAPESMQEFVRALQMRYDRQVKWVAAGPSPVCPARYGSEGSLPQSRLARFILYLRRRGIY